MFIKCCILCVVEDFDCLNFFVLRSLLEIKIVVNDDLLLFAFLFIEQGYDD